VQGTGSVEYGCLQVARSHAAAALFRLGRAYLHRVVFVPLLLSLDPVDLLQLLLARQEIQLSLDSAPPRDPVRSSRACPVNTMQ